MNYVNDIRYLYIKLVNYYIHL